jgi:hypothetical protein
MKLMSKARAAFILFSAAALVFTSCITTDKTLGSLYIPSSQDIYLHTAEIDLPVENRVADNLQSSITGSVIIGSITSDQFGTFRSSAALSFTPASDSITWGIDPEFISMEMDALVTSTQSLKDNQKFIPQNIYAYQLNFELDSTHIYANSVTDKDYIHKSILKNNSIYMGGDSIKMVFTKEFGEKLFKIDMATLDSTELFMKAFYGLYITTDDVEEGLTGGRLNMIDLSTAFVQLTYRSTNAAGVRRDTSASFLLGDRHCVDINEVGSHKLESSNPQDFLYYEGMAGIKPFVGGAALKKAIDNWAKANNIDLSKILISKAVLDFPFEYSGNYKDYDIYPDNLFPCLRRTSGNYKIFSPIDEIESDTDYNFGSINRSLMTYRPDAALYIQDLIKKSYSDLDTEYDIWMMPTIQYSDSYSSSVYYYADYQYYRTGVLNGRSAERHPVLRLTYTVLQ